MLSKFVQNRCKTLNLKQFKLHKKVFNVAIIFVICYKTFYGREINFLGMKRLYQSYDATGNLIDITEACFWIYISKYTECCETFLLILLKRKRYHVVGFYHVIHQCMMPINVWMLNRIPHCHLKCLKYLNSSMLRLQNKLFLKHKFCKEFLVSVSFSNSHFHHNYFTTEEVGGGAWDH